METSLFYSLMYKLSRLIIFILFILLADFALGNSFELKTISTSIVSKDTLIIHSELQVFADSAIAIKKITSITSENKKRLISALFAFPFPFGFMGAHRVMLGTKPWIPVVYVATFGGCFGLLPLIDFCVIVFSKDVEQYENNPNLFMWVK
jgi:TM2 domain-containing membrane protein YozV